MPEKKLLGVAGSMMVVGFASDLARKNMRRRRKRK
jgi:hypothetical protein